MIRSELGNLIQIAKGITGQFGKNTEITIWDLREEKEEDALAFVWNGHISGEADTKKLPGGVRKLKSEYLKNHELDSEPRSFLHRKSVGTILKITDIPVVTEEGEIYDFRILSDVTALIGIMDSMKAMGVDPSYGDWKENPPEKATNVNDLLDQLIEESVRLVGKAPAIMSKDDRVKAIRFLNDRGAFLITRSGDRVASYFGISKYTLYSYIDVKKNSNKK